LVDGRREPHRLFTLRINLAACLCDLERYSEAEALLSEAREIALALRKDLDMLRTVWVGGKVLAGLGRIAEARETFERVRRDFKARGMDFDYALVTLDLAVLLLGLGCTAEVRALAEEMVRIFTRQEIHREALAALTIFIKASRNGEATVELARRLTAYLNQARSDPRLRFEA
jgi:tetratricopeptide (TPR) repeat protein